MALTSGDCGAVILAGGQSRRMGRCKALLEVEGETLIARLARQLSGFGELMISANDETLAHGLPGRLVRDAYPGLGPLAGLHGALAATEKAYLLCVSCDLPFFTGQDAAGMLSVFPRGARAMACVDGGGRAHPLCGIYARSALPVVERRLRQGRLRMLELLEELEWTRFMVREDEAMLTNVNTPEAFAWALASMKHNGK